MLLSIFYPLDLMQPLKYWTIGWGIASAMLSLLFLRKRGGLSPLIRNILLTLSYACAILGLLVMLLYSLHSPAVDAPDTTIPTTSIPSTAAPSQTVTKPSEPEQTVPSTSEPEQTLPSLGNVTHNDRSDPANWDVKWNVFLNGEAADLNDLKNQIHFSDPADTPYFSLPGIATFRGDPYRSGAVYGTADIIEQSMDILWKNEISSLPKADGEALWTGCGWTGQPLIVQWDEATRSIMNLYPEKKDKEGLTEVIYATLDGNIYFYDLEDGSYTRDPMSIGMAFKGAGSLDPRGYPILYVGSGDITADGKEPRMFIISLIDCAILFEYGYHDPLSYRGWTAYDSSPLVDAETDTLIWPGENGLLYSMKLHTHYDQAAGTLTVSPDDIIKGRYTTNLGRSLGFESSSVIVDHYIYLADNGGMLLCVDLNTMELVWCQNLKDDCNASPIFRWEDDGNGYLYCATSMEYSEGNVYVYKVNSANGEILWEKEFTDIYFDKLVSGGILSTPILGKEGTPLEDMLFCCIAKTPDEYKGQLVALDTNTGEILWEVCPGAYTWSSPSLIYSSDGTAYLISCNASGFVMLIDPMNGQILTKISIGANVEASPAIFNDILVVGTRGKQIYAVKLS